MLQSPDGVVQVEGCQVLMHACVQLAAVDVDVVGVRIDAHGVAAEVEVTARKTNAVKQFFQNLFKTYASYGRSVRILYGFRLCLPIILYDLRVERPWLAAGDGQRGREVPEGHEVAGVLEQLLLPPAEVRVLEQRERRAVQLRHGPEHAHRRDLKGVWRQGLVSKRHSHVFRIDINTTSFLLEDVKDSLLK